MIDLWQRLKGEARPVYLYGMGNGADKILDECIRQGIEVKGVFASDGFVRHQLFRGFTVESYSEARKKHPDMTALLCFGSALPEVIESIKQKAEEITLLAPSVPVYGKEIFNSDFYGRNEEKIKNARSLFADEKSRAVYDGIIEYRLSGNINRLFEIETERKENYKLLKLENEIFVDLGAYRGDTVLEVNNLCSLEAVYAVEPDKKSFEKLKRNTEGINDVNYFNCVIAESDGEALISDNRGRGSAVSETGKIIQQKSVDSILGGKRATYIKFDVEGNEEKAIIGARNTIKKYLPKMKIAAYHRSGDIFNLPLLINKISDKYTFYLRHEPSLPDWDTDIIALPKE